MRRHNAPLLLLVMLALLALAAGTSQPAAASEPDRVALGIKPVGVSGSYFDLTASPGEAMQLTVEIGNYGSLDAVALLYPADVYSLVNGGMGVRLAGEPTGDVTDWLRITSESIPLTAGQAVLRSFAIRVPDDAEPGEYVSSVVIEDATAADTTDAGITTKRVNRQAIAVSITVPGPTTPGLSLGAIDHHVSGGRSVVTIDVRNEGNVRLQPSGTLILRSGDQEESFPIRMDSIYAGTTTVAEFTFSSVLAPGMYHANLTLSDERHGVSASVDDVPLTITDAVAAINNEPATSSPAVQSQTTVTQSNSTSSTERWALIVACGVTLTVAVGGAVRWAKARRMSPHLEPVTAPTAAPAVVLNRPVAIRQLAVPTRSSTPPSFTQSTIEPARFKRLGTTRPTHDWSLQCANLTD